LARFVVGDKVRVRQQSSSPYRGCVGIVIKSIDHGFVIVYEVKMESYPSHLTESNRFFEADIDPA
jgi:hypothetical protein